LPSFLQLDQPRLAVAHLLDGSDGGYQIHDLRGLVGRHAPLRAGGEERARRLDEVAGARDLRQIERDRAIAPRRQQQPHAKAQRCPVACQGLGDEHARELLRRALKHGFERKGGLVAGTLRPSPPPAA
jgi:hypothetical protein